MRFELNGRPCEAEAEHGLSDDDSMFARGYWLDTEDDLTEDELDELTKQYPDALYDLWLDHQLARADMLFDAAD